MTQAATSDQIPDLLHHKIRPFAPNADTWYLNISMSPYIIWNSSLAALEQRHSSGCDLGASHKVVAACKILGQKSCLT